MRQRLGLGFGKSSLVLVTCAVAAASCGGRAADDSPAPIAVADFGATWAEAVCAAEGPCCESAGVPYDRPSCTAIATELLRARIEGRMNGRQRYEPSLARPCIDAWVRLARSCGPTSAAQQREAYAICAAVFAGLQPDGAACESEADCASPGSSCIGGTGSARCAHITLAANHGALGAACKLTCDSSECNVGNAFGYPEIVGCYLDDGLSCGVSQTCAAPGKLGEACVPDSCARGAYCEAGLCAPLRDSGPCDDGRLRACSSASYCADGECQLKLPNGSPCSSIDACQAHCDLPVGVHPNGSKRVAVPGVCSDARFGTRQHCAGEL